MNRPRLVGRTTTCALLLLAAACGGGDAGPPVVAAPIRLADLLDSARIESPVLGVRAVQSVLGLRRAPRKVLLAETFEHFDRAAAGWPKSPHGDVIAEAKVGVKGKQGRNHVFRLRGYRPQEVREWRLRARPNAYYVFRRRFRGVAPLPVDLAVIESKPGKAEDGGKAEPIPIKIHRAHYRPGHGWQWGTVAFLSRGNTRWLTVRLMPNNADRQQWPKVRAWFDNILLARIDPTPRQQIALMKAYAPANDADPARGIRKRGQFPRMNEPGDRHSPMHGNFSRRYALYAPPPTELGFPVELGDGATLYFSTCLARQTHPGDAATMEVLVRSGGQDHSLWKATLTTADADFHWHDVRVDLSEFGGRKVEVVLRSRAAKGTPHPVWGNPTIERPTPDGALRNVILIAVDTLRADRLTCYGYGKKTSPNLDRLAADGFRFDNTSSVSTWTSPTFSSIVTGVVPSRHRVFDAAGALLPPVLPTLAERFRAAGWATQSIVYKAPLYAGGYDRGFSVAHHVPRVIAHADCNLAEALDWLERSADRRNFLFLHFDDPHQPFTPPQPFDRMFSDPPASHGLTAGATRETGLLSHQVGAWPRSPEDREIIHALYDGEVAYVDDRIGMFLRALKKRGLYDNAVIAFVADHGEELWDHGRFGHGQDRIYDEVTRVPLIVKPSLGTFPTGRVIETQVRNFDVSPTLMQLAGIAPGDGLDCESLVPLMHPGTTEAPDRLAISEVLSAFGLRTREWKYALRGCRRIYDPSRPAESLFDLRADPGEQHNVADMHPDLVRDKRLQTLDYLMRNRSGRYLVAIGDPKAREPIRYLARGVHRSVSFYGPQPDLAAADLMRYTTAPGAEPALVAGVFNDGEVTILGETEPLRFRRYAPGTLRQLIERGAVGLHAFEGPPDLTELRRGDLGDDLELMDDLRAVGYVGGRPTGSGPAPRRPGAAGPARGKRKAAGKGKGKGKGKGEGKGEGEAHTARNGKGG